MAGTLRLYDPLFSPCFWYVGLLLLSCVAVVMSLWQMVVPRRYTSWDASSSATNQSFIMVGMLNLLPTILNYISWSCWVFGGKARAEIYHDA